MNDNYRRGLRHAARICLAVACFMVGAAMVDWVHSFLNEDRWSLLTDLYVLALLIYLLIEFHLAELHEKGESSTNVEPSQLTVVLEANVETIVLDDPAGLIGPSRFVPAVFAACMIGLMQLFVPGWAPVPFWLSCALLLLLHGLQRYKQSVSIALGRHGITISRTVFGTTRVKTIDRRELIDVASSLWLPRLELRTRSSAKPTRLTLAALDLGTRSRLTHKLREYMAQPQPRSDGPFR